jgi:hypothetical protein
MQGEHISPIAQVARIKKERAAPGTRNPGTQAPGPLVPELQRAKHAFGSTTCVFGAHTLPGGHVSSGNMTPGSTSLAEIQYPSASPHSAKPGGFGSAG